MTKLPTSALTVTKATEQYSDTHKQVIAATNRARAVVGLDDLPWYAVRPFWEMHGDRLNDSKYHCDWFETEVGGEDVSAVFVDQLRSVPGISTRYTRAMDTTHGVVVEYK